jgi:hypothetical protein
MAMSQPPAIRAAATALDPAKGRTTNIGAAMTKRSAPRAPAVSAPTGAVGNDRKPQRDSREHGRGRKRGPPEQVGGTAGAIPITRH